MPLVCNGWTIYFYELFAEQLAKQISVVRKLKASLKQEDFVKHPDVKLLKVLQEGIRDKIPIQPFAVYFKLSNPLEKYCRLKKMGLPARYRLFFRASPNPHEKAIVILWLGFPRKEGDNKDCYKVFKKMVAKNNFPSTISELISKAKDDVQDF